MRLTKVIKVLAQAESDLEWNTEWLERHQVQQTPEGLYILYHATTKDTADIILEQGLRKGSLLEENRDDAAFFAQRDRDIGIEDVVVFEVLLEPGDIFTGHWASVNKDIPPERLRYQDV